LLASTRFCESSVHHKVDFSFRTFLTVAGGVLANSRHLTHQGCD
jgi:hypothetical protein